MQRFQLLEVDGSVSSEQVWNLVLIRFEGAWPFKRQGHQAKTRSSKLRQGEQQTWALGFGEDWEPSPKRFCCLFLCWLNIVNIVLFLGFVTYSLIVDLGLLGWLFGNLYPFNYRAFVGFCVSSSKSKYTPTVCKSRLEFPRNLKKRWSYRKIMSYIRLDVYYTIEQTKLNHRKRLYCRFFRDTKCIKCYL